jgi:hypothetical protein
MKKSKLIELLGSFSGREWSNFQDFVASPYFNKNQAVTALCVLLREQAPAFESVERPVIFRQIFPEQPYQDALLNHTMSFLLKLAEQFIGQTQYEQHAFAGAQYTLKGLLERGLDKHYHYLYEKTARQQNEVPLRNAQYH